MCHGDTSPTAFEENPTKTKPVLSARRSPHMCVDWDPVLAFVNDRVVRKGELARLENPLRINVDEWIVSIISNRLSNYARHPSERIWPCFMLEYGSV